MLLPSSVPPSPAFPLEKASKLRAANILSNTRREQPTSFHAEFTFLSTVLHSPLLILGAGAEPISENIGLGLWEVMFTQLGSEGSARKDRETK